MKQYVAYVEINGVPTALDRYEAAAAPFATIRFRDEALMNRSSQSWQAWTERGKTIPLVEFCDYAERSGHPKALRQAHEMVAAAAKDTQRRGEWLLGHAAELYAALRRVNAAILETETA